MRKRRPITREMKTLFADWKAMSRLYGNGDPFNEIYTIEMYEGIEDKQADAIVAADILEHMPEPAKALEEIKGLAKKACAFFIMPDALRSKETWEKIIGKYFPIVETRVEPTGHIWVHCSATNPFGRKNIVAAGTEEGRWENLVANCKAVSKRINRRAPIHDRTTLVACYGPSLKSYIGYLINEMKEGDRDIVSVSGSHDFLLSHGIVPRYHVECDPRSHKADNIATGHPDVEYLLSSMVHPVLMDKLKGCNITLWHPVCERTREIKEFEPDALFIGGGGNVGLRTLPLFHVMGSRIFSIYGMDCSFANDGQMWAGPHAQKKNPIDHGKMKVRCGDRTFLTTPSYITYANAFFDTVKVLPDAQFRVFGDSLLQAMCRTSNCLIEATEAA